jgi:hypothetical protein|tara:strand:- start:808 stop:1101 length:294 start_codon:yes stop_codon:yes gene_type:complete
MKEPNELENVLSQAVESYLICQVRNKARGRPTGDLSKKYPKHFKKLPNGKFRWIGKSPDSIIEDYLEQFGYPPGSYLWHQLSEMVIKRARSQPEEDY